MKKMIKVVMVEDHPDYRESIRLALETEPDIELTKLCGTAEQALRHLGTSPQVDIILLDLNLPGVSGLKAISWFKEYFPNIKIIILTQSNQESDVLHAINQGAAGYLLKESTLSQITSGIREVDRGNASLDPSIAKYILDTLRTKIPEASSNVSLSTRELEVLTLLSEGLIKKEISERLNIETTTVATHVRRIYEKLEAPNAAAAVRAAYKKNIL